MSAKNEEDFDDELELDASEEISELNAGESFSRKLTTAHGVGRVRRNWRDVERAREEREMRRLLNGRDDWLADLEAPSRQRAQR